MPDVAVQLEISTSSVWPLSNDSVWFGVNGTRSYPCPPGYYCPQNSSEPTPCPTGTYNRLEVRMSSGSKT